jgi:hypothetical protein
MDADLRRAARRCFPASHVNADRQGPARRNLITVDEVHYVLSKHESEDPLMAVKLLSYGQAVIETSVADLLVALVDFRRRSLSFSLQNKDLISGRTSFGRGLSGFAVSCPCQIPAIRVMDPVGDGIWHALCKLYMGQHLTAHSMLVDRNCCGGQQGKQRV